MIFSGSLITVKENKLSDVTEFLKNYPQVEIYTSAEDKQNIVVAIEAESDEELEELSKTLNSNENIINIAHHYFHFEEEVEEIEKGNKRNISLKGFGKKNKKQL
ncbi:chaperone NapD [Flexistipes sp.]|uniref:chaperone NapD n=1 Tax=Flexistipes sp. TaxID=3088135 RepID=UPI002E1C5330|nr:chaperone NapD [Flexistipes sp.]